MSIDTVLFSLHPPTVRHFCERLSCTVRAGGVAGCLLLLSGLSPTMAQQVLPADGMRSPLVVFSPGAAQAEGDHDYQQVIRVTVPKSDEAVNIRLFDPDVGGAFDEPQSGFGSRTRFSLYGAGSAVSLMRDEDGIWHETVSGKPIGMLEFGAEETIDGTWQNAWTIHADQGADVPGGRRFLILAEGISGNDGNVFDVDLRTPSGAIATDARLGTMMPTFQLPDDSDSFIEVRFRVPEDADRLIIENFDSAGATITYDGRFRSQSLKASGRSKWASDSVELFDGEAGQIGSVTARSGNESPNDTTLIVAIPDDNGELTPLMIDLPMGHFPDRPRPLAEASVRQTSCGMAQFTASVINDPDGQVRWRPADGLDWQERDQIQVPFDRAGRYTARLEVHNGTAMVRSRSAQLLPFEFKAAPAAALLAPTIVAATAAGTADVTLDGTKSSPSALPDGNAISRYIWDFGDGHVQVQTIEDPTFGKPTYRFQQPGVYSVTLTVNDVPGHACNSASTTATIVVNQAPVADAGEPKAAAPGDVVSFDGGPTIGADGDQHTFSWAFGDGQSAAGAQVDHRYGEPGTYAVTLTVDDGAGAANSIQIGETSVAVNAAPSASGVRVPNSAVVGKTILLDARAAAERDGTIIDYQWRLSDGTLSGEPAFMHTFRTAGEHSATLRLTDNSGLANGQTRTDFPLLVTPQPNQSPVARSGGNRIVIAGELLAFDGSQSTDPDGNILSYRWDFGDGRHASGIQTRHTYDAPGSYLAKLTVVDNSGADNSAGIELFSITVEERPNILPEIVLDVPADGSVDEVLDFLASRSTDPDGNINLVAWDFGDGSTATGQRATHSYRTPGRYDVTVTIGDDSGRPDGVSVRRFPVEIGYPPNTAPQLAFPSRIDLLTDQIMVFDARGAMDPDGAIISVDWDFGDGQRSAELAVEHAYSTPGRFMGKLVLQDDSGLPSRIATLPFEVVVTRRPNRPPVAEAGPDQESIVGQAVMFDGGQSVDKDGSLIRYHWDFGNGKTAVGQRRSIAYFAPGTYTVTLTLTDNSAQANDTSSDTLTVVVADMPNSTPVASADADRPAAIDEPVPFSAVTTTDDDGSILSYVWDFGDGNSGSGREVTHRYSASGEYVARLTVRDDSGLQSGISRTTRTILVNAPPVADAGPDQHVTASQVLFDASGSVDSDGEIIWYRWDFGDGETGEGRRVIHTYRRPGTYQVSLRIADSSGTIRNEATDDMQVRVNALPVADAGFDLVAAPGETLTMDGRRSSDPDGTITAFDWDFGDGNSGTGGVVEHRYDQPGTYTVELTVTDNSGHSNATDFSQILVAVNDQPIANAGPDIAVEPGQQFTIRSGQSIDPDGLIVEARWDIQGIDQPVIEDVLVHGFDTPGIYPIRLTVTDDSFANNNTAQDEVLVHVNSTPVAVAGKDQFVGDRRVVFDARGSSDPDGDGLVYRWNLGDGNSAEGAVVEHVYQTGGIYPVVLTVDDGRGFDNSTSSDSLKVTINRAPIAIAGASKEVCVGDIVVFDGSASRDPDFGLLKYRWQFGDGNTSEIVNPTKVYAAPGTYSVNLSVTDESGEANASHQDEAIVTVLPAPVSRAGADLEVCAGASVQFDGTASTDVDGVVNSYSWDFGDGQSGGGDRPSHVYDTAGIYRASLQIEGDNLGLCSPTSSDDLIVTVLPAPESIIDAPSYAAVGESVTFDAGASIVPDGSTAEYRWTIDGVGEFEGAQIKQAFDAPGTYRLTLKVAADQSAGGCASAEAIHTIRINAAPVADGGGDRVGEAHRPLTFRAAASTDPDGGISGYRWDFGDGNTATGIEVRHSWKEAGRYAVTLTVDDGTGLENSIATDEFIVDIQPPPSASIVAADRACPGEPLALSLANVPPDAAGVSWSFGDGATGSGRALTHRFAQPGHYTLGARFTEERGGVDTTTPLARQLTVNQHPHAVAIAERVACAGDDLAFDGSGSHDPDGRLLSYNWSFGDGTEVQGATATHRYSKPGVYSVRLQVQDNSGTQCSTDDHHFTVRINSPPTPDAGPDREFLVGGAADTIILDAGGSSDADGDPLEHYWELSDGQIFDGEKVRIDELEPGQVTAILVSNDSHGLDCSEGTDTVQLTIIQRVSTQEVLD